MREGSGGNLPTAGGLAARPFFYENNAFLKAVIPALHPLTIAETGLVNRID